MRSEPTPAPVHFARRDAPWPRWAPVVESWGAIGTARLRFPAAPAPLGRNVTHFVGLNLAGEDVLEIADRSTGWIPNRVPPGSLTVFPADLEFRFRAGQGNDSFGISIEPEFALHVLGDEAPQLLRPAIGFRDDVAEPVVRAILGEVQVHSPGAGGRVERLAAVLLSRLAERPDTRQVFSPSDGAVPGWRIRKVLAFIEAHLDEPLHVSTLAGLAGQSVSSFYQSFKDAVGCPPHRYVRSLRIGRAKELLTRGGRSITEIAVSTGFSTPSHFSAVFHRETGVSPRAWRRRR